MGWRIIVILFGFFGRGCIFSFIGIGIRSGDGRGPFFLWTANHKLVVQTCRMARDLGLVSQVREVVRALAHKVKEPENRGKDTACCGGSSSSLMLNGVWRIVERWTQPAFGGSN
jgi:hypothetical protein